MLKSYITFPTTYHAVRAESILKGAGIPCRLVPVPRRVSSVCAVALQCECSTLSRIEFLFFENAMLVEGIYHIDENEFSLLGLFRK